MGSDGRCARRRRRERLVRPVPLPRRRATNLRSSRCTAFRRAPTTGTACVPALGVARDVLVVDVPGFGLSAKPDRRYGLRGAADAIEAAVDHFAITHVDLLTHDMGDSVGGELLARDLDGRSRFSVGRRVLTNGSIYLEMAHLTDGQQLLLSLPDERNDAVGGDGGAAFARGCHGDVRSRLTGRRGRDRRADRSSPPATAVSACCRARSATSRTAAPTSAGSPGRSRRIPRRSA